VKVIQVMFDTLRRDYLTPYGGTDISTPNFERLAEKSVRFDNFFAGSLPCMPARRELHTGRYNFLHRSWGPVEPFDDSMPEILTNNGVYTHLVTDHKHYWRDGGSTYHPRYSSYELIRGQEGDRWKPRVMKNMEIDGLENLPPQHRERKLGSISQDLVNREYMKREEDHPLYRTVEAGLHFLRENKDADNWFLQIECFDPHEPFFVPKKYLDMCGVSDEFDGWITYTHDDFSNEKRHMVQGYYKALVKMCDDYLGKVLDYMDECNLWEDTMLIVNTDHGFLLGEHEWWGKNIMPFYNEVAQLPFFIWDPRLRVQNVHCEQLSQTIDIPVTILEFFNLTIPNDMLGKPLTTIIKDEHPNHDDVLFGSYGSSINVSDGKYVYMRFPNPNFEGKLYEYTLSPMRMERRFTPNELANITLDNSFNFTKGLSVLKIVSDTSMMKSHQRYQNRLYNYKEDPKQEQPIDDIKREFEMIQRMKSLMKENDAPQELYAYYGLDKINTEYDLRDERDILDKEKTISLDGLSFNSSGTKEGYLLLQGMIKGKQKEELTDYFISLGQDHLISDGDLQKWVEKNVNINEQPFTIYQLNMALRID
jgi:arylsulfatase A-like enzyme